MRNTNLAGIVIIAGLAGWLCLNQRSKNPSAEYTFMAEAQGVTTLYKRAANGNIRQWSIWISHDPYTIHTSHGWIGGKIVEDAGLIIEKGKQNRDAEEQAHFQKESKTQKKRDEGYVDTVELAENAFVLRPMLAVDFNKRGKSIEFPAIAQRKFDGVRCLSFKKDGELFLQSRKGKFFPHLNHIRDAVSDIPPNLVLDGELFSATLSFQKVVGLVRKERLTAEDEVLLKEVDYRLYDCIDLDDEEMPFIERYDLVDEFVGDHPSPYLIMAENFLVASAIDIKRLNAQFVGEGFEGVIIRNIMAPYGINKRSKDLQKYKEFFDDEYKIVGYTEGKGNDAGTVIWICETPNKQQFRARPRGSREQRQEWFQNGDSFIGGVLTVRFQELTDDGIPRFPVGIAIRDYE